MEYSANSRSSLAEGEPLEATRAPVAALHSMVAHAQTRTQTHGATAAVASAAGQVLSQLSAYVGM